MKIKYVFVILFVFALAVCFTCNAEGMIRHKVADCGVSISLPEDWCYADRSVDENNAFLLEFDCTIDEIMDVFTEQNKYFYAVAPDSDDSLCFIYLVIEDANLEDFSKSADAFLLSFGKQMEDYFSSMGYWKVIKTRIVGEKYKFLKIVMQSINNDSFDIRYYTVDNGKLYTLSFTDKNMGMQTEDERLMDDIVKSFSVNNVESVSYHIDSLNMEIEIPNDLIVLDEEDRDAIGKGMNYQLYAYTPDLKFRVHVDMINDQFVINSFNGLSQEEKEQYCELFQQISDDAYGNGSSHCSFVEMDGVTYIKMLLGVENKGEMFYELSYITVLNSKCFSITFDPEVDAAGNYTEMSQKYMDSILESIRYDESALTGSDTVQVNETGPKTYRCTSPDVSISIPSRFNVLWRNMPADSASLYFTGISIDNWDSYCEQYPEVILEAGTAESDEQIKLTSRELTNNINLASSDDEMVRRYIGSIYDAQGKNSGRDSSAYMILRNESVCYVVSSGILSVGDLPYTLAAYSMIGNRTIYLVYNSKNQISEKEKEEFMEMVQSIVVDGKEKTELKQSEWFTVNDIEACSVPCGELLLKIPAEYLYYDKTNRDDLCLNARGFDFGILDQIMRLGGDGIEIYITNYDISESISVKKGYVDDSTTIDAANQSSFVEEYARMFESSEDVDIILMDYGSFTGGITDYSNADAVSLNKVYWAKVDVLNMTHNVEQVMYTTVINGVQYIVTLETKATDYADKRKFEKFIRGIQRSGI